MARQSRDARQDAALVQLLKALPEERLDGILEALGVLAEDREAGERKRDPRRCNYCGEKWLRHKALAEHDGHDWDPHPASRADA